MGKYRVDDGFYGLLIAIKNKHLDIVQYLIENGADIMNNCTTNRHIYPELHYAVINHDIKMIKYLTSPYFLSLSEKHKNIINVTDINNATPIHVCCTSIRQNNKLEILKYLIEIRIDINGQDCYGNTALHIVSRQIHDNIEIIKCLINNGININIQNKEGNTALHLVANSNFEKIKYLIDNGADINIKNNNGNTILQCVPPKFKIIHSYLLQL